MNVLSGTLILEDADVPAPGRRMDRSELHRQLELLHPESFGWALACCARERAEAEDVLHTAYEAILDGRARYDGRSQFRTWLFGVIRMTAIARRRWRLTRWLRWERSLDGRDPADPASSAAADVAQDGTAERLARALRSLPSRQREVLHLVFYQDQSIREAAEVLGISVGSARTHYERGKQRLRALLAGDER